ncbi:MAG: hypothetical protein U9Q81_02365 [Pseudomonadota bacterium]|nr:hypothetical protein [Pseudomonadota bacterium]
MERCPNCRARWDGNETCRRCGMDLAALFAVEKAAEHLTVRGIARLAAEDTVAGRHDLSRALDLRREPFAEMLLGFARQLEAEISGTGNFGDSIEISGTV